MTSVNYTPQQKLIVDYLDAGKTLTNKTAIMCLGIGSLSSRMAELKRKGYEFTTEKDFDERDETHYVKYKASAKKAPAAEA